jgi:hypothetical protein
MGITHTIVLPPCPIPFSRRIPSIPPTPHPKKQQHKMNHLQKTVQEKHKILKQITHPHTPYGQNRTEGLKTYWEANYPPGTIKTYLYQNFIQIQIETANYKPLQNQSNIYHIERKTYQYPLADPNSIQKTRQHIRQFLAQPQIIKHIQQTYNTHKKLYPTHNK